ncbi:MAG: alpha-amylase family glycosyl hydrolase [Ignavibacteria bacterium]|nr:alpha-amylase family glycosyl hydrolase [Ignavibacteria bacterium]
MSTTLKIFLFIQFAQAVLLSQTNTPGWVYNASIYEVNVRQFSEQGTFKAFQKHLPRLKEMGVDILWLMPINPIGEKNRKGTLGSYYSVKDYKKINPEFGSKEDFKNLVDEIHKKGMCVIVDWVANHTSWDNPWVTDHPDFYTKDSLGNFVPPVPDWSDVIDLNYDNKELWKEMTDALKYWVKEFNIDGYRCDVAGMLPIEFWNEVRPELDKIKPVFMLAEWDTPEMHNKAFDMTYDWDLHKLMNGIYKGEKSPSDLKEHIVKDQQIYPDYAIRMQFTSNHDENTWNGTEFERLGDAAEMFAVFTNVIPGMPLIYSGQEAAFNKRLDFFEKDLIVWKKSSFTQLYSKLNNLKNENKALWNGIKGGAIEFVDNSQNENALAFIRNNGEDKVFAIFNMSAKEIEVKINSRIIKGSYIDFDNDKSVEIKKDLNVVMKPWSYKLYYTKK